MFTNTFNPDFLHNNFDKKVEENISLMLTDFRVRMEKNLIYNLLIYDYMYVF